jgi:hypothetical protein
LRHPTATGSRRNANGPPRAQPGPVPRNRQDYPLPPSRTPEASTATVSKPALTTRIRRGVSHALPCERSQARRPEAVPTVAIAAAAHCMHMPPLSVGGLGPRLAVRYNSGVATFHVLLTRSGPEWDRSRPMEEQSDWEAHAAFMDGLVDDGFIVLGGPLADEHRVVHVVEADSEDAVRDTLARDPWSESHLRVGSIDPWTIRLDGRG